MVVAAGSGYHSCKKLEHYPPDIIELPTVVPPFYSSKDLNELRKLKLELLAKNSTSKASVYYTPPELRVDDVYLQEQEDVMTIGHSQNNLQVSPIHINYINDNFYHSNDEFDCMKTPEFLLKTTPTSIAIEVSAKKPYEAITEVEQSRGMIGR